MSIREKLTLTREKIEKEFNVKISFECAPRNPNFDSKDKFNFFITITDNNDNKLETYFSQGWKNPMGRKTTWEYEKESIRLRVKNSQPDWLGVLYSLDLETLAVEGSFENWCADLGYSEDSIKDLNTYNICAKQGKVFRKIFGDSVKDFLESEGYE